MDLEYSWPYTKKRRYREVSLMQERKKNFFLIFELSKREHDETCSEFYCAENIQTAHTMVHKETFKT